MKKTILSTLGGLFLILSAPIALADDIPSNALPISKILQDLHAKGYTLIKKVEFEHGTYEVKAIGPNGNKMKLQVNPQTGEITNNKSNNAKMMSMLDAVKKVESAGYHNIYKIKQEDNKYEVKALDKNGKKVELKINADTGEIKKEGWFD